MGKVIEFRHNIMCVSAISTFENIKGGMNNNCKDVYFVRAVGTNNSYLNDVEKLDEALLCQMNEGKSFYYRVNQLPKMVTVEDTSFYVECYSKWIDSGKNEILTKITKDNGSLSLVLANACNKVEELYKSGNRQLSESMVKNFIVKLLYWFDEIFDGNKTDKVRFTWDVRKSIKIVAANVEKKQEYLFYYMLTLTGCDVLLLQSNKDISEEDEVLGLSKKFVLGTYSDIQIQEYAWRETREAKRPQAEAQRSPVTSNENNIARENSVPRVVIPPRANTAPRVIIPPRENSAPRVVIPPRENATDTALEKSFEELALLASSIVMIAIHDNKGEVIGSGSGIMIGREGYILTNNHVTCGGKYYSVRIEDDDNVYKTDEMIKYNQFLDLAIIRIDRKLDPIKVYNGSKKLVRGQKVVAIGSPLGLFNSVSDGIISGFRKIDEVDMIQFTAPTSHGSSGGAVLNMQGEVIGISTAGFSSGQNINLAVGYECINQFIRGFT